MSKQETPLSPEPVRRSRRTYSAQFKAQLVAACQQPGASVAALALQHGINANVLHRWRREHEQGQHALGNEGACAGPMQAPSNSSATLSRTPASTAGVARSMPAFLVMDLPRPVATALPTPASPAPPEIRIECCHHGTQLTVHWPVAAVAECGHWLQAFLRAPP